MSESPQPTEFKIWAAEDVVYGPVPLATVEQWVREERVVATTWVHLGGKDQWIKAGNVAELEDAFAGRSTATGAADEVTPLVMGLRPGMLRRVRALSGMNDQQLGRFVQIMEIVKADAYKVIVHQGAPGDAMYAVLDGEVRARIIAGGKETELARFGPGDIFGEMALFDGGRARRTWSQTPPPLCSGSPPTGSRNSARSRPNWQRRSCSSSPRPLANGSGPT